MAKVRRDPSYSDDQVEELWERYWAGDDDARKSLHHVYLPLVNFFANHYKNKIPSYADSDGLVTHAFIGLDDAITKFIDNRGAKFETYAASRVRGAILDFLRSSDWLPRGMRKIWRDYQDASDEFLLEFQREPTLEEVCERTGLEYDVLLEALMANDQSNMTHYNTPSPEYDRELNLSDVLEDSSNFDSFFGYEISELLSKLSVALEECLEEREALTIYWKYVEEEKLSVIADRLQVQLATVTAIHNSALTKLYDFVRSEF